MDHARIPDDEQWRRLLEECGDLVVDLVARSAQARRRAKAVVTGFPARSMPESSIAAGRVGDPVAVNVERLAGGRSIEAGDREDRPDDWRGPKDAVNTHVNRMIAEASDACNRLRGAVAAMEAVLPRQVHDVVEREKCAVCGTPKSVVTGWGRSPKEWVVSEAKCATCVRRENRNAKAAPVGQSPQVIRAVQKT